MPSLRKSSRKTSNSQSLKLDAVHIGDSRLISKELATDSVQVTITSPPYFNLKDYGVANQIGFGQDYDAYLTDLTKVFSEVFRATKEDGSLWIVIDTFRKDQEVLPLPFDLAARLKTVGWILRDIIIWKKERTLPWTQAGATRKIFEYVLVLSKGTNEFHYDPDKYRDTSDLKRWWVRYPERYNPKGKSLEEIWSYDIPTQGSWGEKYIRHFCPLPSELVSRIIQLTTNPGGVVLDPFAGSGTVPTVSNLLGRAYIGIELNPEYVEMFKRHLSSQQKKKTDLAEDDGTNTATKKASFENTIIKLRILKFARLVLKTLKKELPDEAIQVYAFQLQAKPKQKFKLCSAEYLIVVPAASIESSLTERIEQLCSAPPLSKFGVEANLKFVAKKTDFSATRQKTTYYRYTNSNSHFTTGRIKFLDAWQGEGELLSPIKLEVREPYE